VLAASLNAAAVRPRLYRIPLTLKRPGKGCLLNFVHYWLFFDGLGLLPVDQRLSLSGTQRIWSNAKLPYCEYATDPHVPYGLRDKTYSVAAHAVGNTREAVRPLSLCASSRSMM
jgi:hypothetical protein